MLTVLKPIDDSEYRDSLMRERIKVRKTASTRGQMVGEVGGGYLSWDGGTANATMHSVSRMSLDRRYLSAILGYPIARSLIMCMRTTSFLSQREILPGSVLE